MAQVSIKNVQYIITLTKIVEKGKYEWAKLHLKNWLMGRLNLYPK